MLLFVFLALLAGCIALWAIGAPVWLVFPLALAAWIAFYFVVLPKLRTYTIVMGIDDRLVATETTGWQWILARLDGLKVILLGFVTSMVPFAGSVANWLDGKDLSVFFGPDRGPRMTFYVGAIVFAIPFLTSWLHIGALKNAAETEPKAPTEKT